MKVAFRTLGCKVNRYESEAMGAQFKAEGYELVNEEDFADAYVINTCTVTGLADRKSRQYIRRIKRKSPDSVIAVVGCYVQTCPDEVEALKEVDIMVGNNEKCKLVEFVSRAVSQKKENSEPCQKIRQIVPLTEMKDYEEMGVVMSMESRSRAYIKIQEGCNRFCTYCIIPYARGAVRSRQRENILREAEALVKKGFGEIILTGINTALYRDLPGLLKDMDDMAGDFRVRLSSLEPTVVDRAFIEKILDGRRLCHHLHLSVQSGSDKVLKAMGRRYGRTEYLDVVKSIREFDPLYGITTDMIVGFPREDEEDFNDSIDIVKKVEFCGVHVFPYSRRKGTPAAEMSGQVADLEKKKRSEIMIKTGAVVSRLFVEKNCGTEQRVIFEKVEGNYQVGYTDNYIRAYTDKRGSVTGRMQDVTLEEPFKDGVWVKSSK